MAIGYFLGGGQGAGFALVFSILFNIGSYWFSDKIILSLYRAKELPPGQAPELVRTVGELCGKAGLPMPRIYLIPEEIPNAFATGRDEHHAVLGVTAGILRVMDMQQLRGVLAHELCHVKNKDMLVSTIAATLAGAISFLARSLAFFGSDDRRQNFAGELLFLILTPLLAMLIQLAISRTREYEADASGARLLGEGMSLARALRTLQASARSNPVQPSSFEQSTAHLFITNPFTIGFFGKLFSTHPPLEERIARLERGDFMMR